MKLFLVYFFSLVVLSRTMELANLTDSSIENDDDDLLSEINFEQFKNSIRRYRRLIPYMSFYISNYNVDNQRLHQLHQQSNENFLPPPPVVLSPINAQPPLKPKQIVIIPQPKDSWKKPLNQQRTTTLVEPEKFIPSVQYDPKDIGGDNDYFMPVRYNKVSYDEYHRNYERRPPPSYPEITTPSSQVNRYYAKERPVRPKILAHNLPLYDRQYPKQVTRLPDHVFEYNLKQKPTPVDDLYYPVDDFESLKFIKVNRPLENYHQPIHVTTKPAVYAPRYSELHDKILKSLQLTNQLPEMLNKDNIDSSIKTLVEILSLLNSAKKQEASRLPETPVVEQNIPAYKEFKVQHSQPKVVTETRFQATPAPIIPDEIIRFKAPSYSNNVAKPESIKYSDYNDDSGLKNQNVIQLYSGLVQDMNKGGNFATYTLIKPQITEDSHQSSYEITEDAGEKDKELPPIVTEAPPSHYQLTEGFNTPTMSIKSGAIRGKPNLDYPTYASIPHTDFNCKDQRYKGFFGDPSTRCQVWHYCDLNGGKSSFLCPNGTIFSQVALTCDWWFNVKCESTTQLYVLNERLYKFILPIMPKFPEDFIGPEVDRYLELKFKEMEAKLKAKKLKKIMEKKTKEKPQQVNQEE
ncbi:uncharacterized protein [Chelonus insularis]|uniref:uncharacterized protein n=1 Tax=Chelonus insularis TaxID=460826 RepID=UPI00158B5B82|nr:uncharacterized protein LOC118069268 [Chelonus insularis]